MKNVGIGAVGPAEGDIGCCIALALISRRDHLQEKERRNRPKRPNSIVARVKAPIKRRDADNGR
jgi:hypothetical protein